MGWHRMLLVAHGEPKDGCFNMLTLLWVQVVPSPLGLKGFCKASLAQVITERSVCRCPKPQEPRVKDGVWSLVIVSDE